MKTKHKVAILALAALITGTSHAAITGKSSGFMDKRQLAAWRAENASKSTETKQEDSAFFTGRPYLASTDTYAFKFRSYDPIVARWTSEDPSGFPDGANSSQYTPCPTSDFDFEGLLNWSTLKNKNATYEWKHAGDNLISDLWSVETNDGSATIRLLKNTKSPDGTSPPDTDYSYNCHGYTFGGSQYWISGQILEILKGDGYKLITGPDKTGARVAYWGGNLHSAIVNTVTDGTVTQVTGKKGGSQGLLISTPAEQRYGDDINYYE